MKKLQYEIINSVHGLIERYIIIDEQGNEVQHEKKLNTDDMLKLHIRSVPINTDEIKRRR